MNNTKNKCDFCIYWTGSSCSVTPNSAYCRAASDEYKQYINDFVNGVKSKAPLKSFRKWDKK